MVATQNSETLNNIIFASLLGQGYEESAPAAAGPGEVDPRGVERVHERAQGRLLGEPVQFHEEGFGRLPEPPRPVEEGPPERAGVGVPPGGAQPGPEPFDQVGREHLGPRRPGQGGGVERRAMYIGDVGAKLTFSITMPLSREKTGLAGPEHTTHVCHLRTQINFRLRIFLFRGRRFPGGLWFFRPRPKPCRSIPIIGVRL